jgi:hypothetical protein
MKQCSICNTDISHKTSNSASKCEKCCRRINENSLNRIKERKQKLSSVRKEILLAYNSCCVICGWKIIPKNCNGKYLHQSGCDIHHIIPVREGGKDVFENCILLCPNHHKEADLGIITKDILLSYIIKEKDKTIEFNRFKSMSEGFDILSSIY